MRSARRAAVLALGMVAVLECLAGVDSDSSLDTRFVVANVMQVNVDTMVVATVPSGR